MASNKTYLGDSVYAEHDGFHVILTTENGDICDPGNRIALEPSVLASLNDWHATLFPRPEFPTLPAGPVADKLNSALRNFSAGMDEIKKGANVMARIIEGMPDTIDFNLYGGTFWFTCSKREDVQHLLQLAPRWEKSASETGIDYDAVVDGVSFKIRTIDGALPPTCKLVKKVVTIPATEERQVERMVVECAQVVDSPVPEEAPAP